MKDLKITKGEWHTGNYVPNLICTDQFEQSVAIAQWDGTVVTKDEAIANAKLIASAPDLFRAVQLLLSDNDSPQQYLDAVEFAKRTIKKATE